MDTCPVVKVIREIHGAGLADEDTGRVALAWQSQSRRKRGGAEDNDDGTISKSVVMDEVAFYITMRKMELARFELSAPSVTACAAKYRSMFRDTIDVTYSELYTRLVDKVVGHTMRDRFVRLIDMLGDMESLIIIKADMLARDGRAINVSLPDMCVGPSVAIVHQPEVLCAAANIIIDYVNNIRIDSLLRTPTGPSRIPHIAAYSGPTPDMTTAVSSIVASTAAGYMAGMQKILSHEVELAMYVRDVEAYHCKVINHLGAVFVVCDQLIDGLRA